TIGRLRQYCQLFDGQRRQLLASLPSLPPPDEEQFPQLLDAVGECLVGVQGEDGPALRMLFGPLLAQLQHAESLKDSTDEDSTDAMDESMDESMERLATLYCEFGPNSAVRHRVLQVLATMGTPAAIRWFAQLIVEDPPRTAREADLAFAPLWTLSNPPVDEFFPRLFDALPHQGVAALVLDLANHLTRNGLATEHPARERAAHLAGLFGGLADRMKRLEEKPTEFAQTAEELSEIIAQCVSLGTALADSLGLIGDVQHLGALRKALEIGHRRLRAEAAAAVARLGDEDGIEILAQLAQDPGARVRALAYLEELEKLDQAREEDRSPDARAEGELALFLSQPTQFGLPPTRLDMIDSRELRWPGWEEPVACRLFIYTYQFPNNELQRVGLAGPMTYSLRADVDDLPLGEIYALYCGWQVEHDDIQQKAAADLTPSERKELASVEQRLRE
ncbi:MAG: HEAT repeat domain-containing protein, partial [Planctomycetales bacterium]